MRKAKLILLIIIGLFGSKVFCQTTNNEWSDPIKASPNSKSKFIPLGWKNNNYYFIQSKVGSYSSKGSYLNSLSDDLGKENRIKLTLPKMSSAGYIVRNDSDLLVIGPVHRDNETKVMAYRLGYDGVLKSKSEITQFPIPYSTYFNRVVFDNYYPSIDRSDKNSVSTDKALISCAYIRKGRNSKYKQNNSKLDVCVFKKDDLTPLYSTSYIFQKNSENINVSGQQVDNEGNLAVIVSFSDKVDENIRDYMYIFNKNGDLLDSNRMYYQDYRLNYLQLITTSENKIKIMGTYNNKQVEDGVYVKSPEESLINKGFFLADFDIKKQTVENFNLASTEEDNASISGKNNERLNDNPFKLSYIKDYDGGGYIIRERRYTSWSSTMDGTPIICHYAKELLVTPFNKNNEFLSSNVLVKNQKSLNFNRNFMNYFSFLDQDGLHIIYNKLSSKYDENDKSLSFPQINKGAIVVHQLIDQENKLTKQNEFNASEKEGFLIPGGCFSNEEKALLYLGWFKYRKVKIVRK